MTGQTTFTLSSPQQLDFTEGGATTLGDTIASGTTTTVSGFTYALPSSLYHKFGVSFGPSDYGGFTVGAYAQLRGGIRAGVTVSVPSILPSFELDMNPQVQSYVQQGQLFSVTPELVTTQDAGFSLNLPTLDANFGFGLQGTAGASLGFPDVHVPFHTFSGPTISKSISVGSFYSLPSNGSVSFPGGSASATTLGPSTVQSGVTSGTGPRIPDINETFKTAPIFQVNVDIIQALSKEIPELKAIDGSESFGVGSASWSLLSLPLNASLYLADTISASEIGSSEVIHETVGGQTTLVKSSVSGSGTYAIGTELDIRTPSFTGPGYGQLALEEDYKFTMAVASTLSLNGFLSFYLDGPAASASIFGKGFSVGPVFSQSLIPSFVPTSGKIFTIGTTTNDVTIAASQRQLVFYGTNAASTTLGTKHSGKYSIAGEYKLRAGGDVLTIGSNVDILANPGPHGVEATLGAAGVYNYGTINSMDSTQFAVDLAKGGQLVNETTGWLFGVEIGGAYSTIINSGSIVNREPGVYSTSPIGDGVYVFNEAGGVIRGGNDGIASAGAKIILHNQGSIFVEPNTNYGVDGVKGAAGGVLIYNDAGGSITGANAGVYTDAFGLGSSYIQNHGAITGGAFGVDLTNALLANFGTITGGQMGVRVGKASLLYNAGVINGDVALTAASDMLELAPGEAISGAATDSYGDGTLILEAGSGRGTLKATGGYTGFPQIDIADDASWLLQSYDPNFNGATISGLTSQDQIDFRLLRTFVEGETASLDPSTGLLSIVQPGGSTIASVKLQPGTSLNNARFNVFYAEGGTYVREFTGAHFSNVLAQNAGRYSLELSPQVINANSYFGPTSSNPEMIVPKNSAVGYSSSYPGRQFAIDLQPILVATTIFSGGPKIVTHVVQPTVLENQGEIFGKQQGVLVQTAATIINDKSSYLGTNGYGDGVEQTGGTYLEVMNSGAIIGNINGIVLNAFGVIGNMAGADISASDDAIEAQRAATIQNAGVISGANVGVQLAFNGVVQNGATGTITGQTGVAGSSANNVVTNAGSIGGGVSLSHGGVVNNTYQLINNTPVWGTISGGAYGVVVSGGAADVTNGVGTIGGATSLALIQGVSLAAASILDNGRYGVIQGAQGAAFGVKVGAASHVYNGGTIGGGLSIASGVVENAGVIGAAGNGDAIQFGSVASTLIIDPGSTINGGGVVNSHDILELGVGHGVGYFDNIFGTNDSGPVYIPGFGQTVVAAGSVWDIGGAASDLSGNWFVAGTISAARQDGLLVVDGSLKVTGVVNGNNAYSSTYASGVGLYLDSSARVANSGQILGGAGSEDFDASDGVDVASGALLVNSGLIAGGNNAIAGGAGVNLGGGVLVNTGDIGGGSNVPGYSATGGVGVIVHGGAITTGGTISGGSGADAVQFTSSGGGLVLEPGAAFNGVVAGDGNVLRLAGTAAGTLSGLGSQFTGFARLVENAGANWTLTGANAAPASLNNLGVLNVSAGTLATSGAVSNTGEIVVESGGLASIAQAVLGTGKMIVEMTGTLSLGGGVASTQVVDFQHGGLLDIGNALGFHGTISDFAASGGIDLLSTPVTSEVFVNHFLILNNNSTRVANLDFSGSYTLKNFHVGSDGHGGTSITWLSGKGSA